VNITEKLISGHLKEGAMEAGQQIGLAMDQVLTQDATGTMVYLQFEAMGLERIRADLAVSYADHNTLQVGFENMDDHRFLKSAAAKYGAYFSSPGNGICHQVHLERFSKPGATLIGSDSHTPTGGGMGMLAIGAGGIDVASALAGEPYHITMPEVVEVHLSGNLSYPAAAKDVILELLRRLGVKGGKGKVFEYTGPGVDTLSVPERAVITNMGTELGATSSVFPADDITKEFLRFQEREQDFSDLTADKDAVYAETIEIDLSSIEPLAACPHMPDNVKSVKELAGTKVHQICIGSCTNSSLKDLETGGHILKGKQKSSDVSLTVSPGSRQVLRMIQESGALSAYIDAGARMLECTCGPCIGMGQSPGSGLVSVRTFNRNFFGRSGTKEADIYLTSVETAAACALYGAFVAPEEYPPIDEITLPEKAVIDDSLIIPPPDGGKDIELVKGPNIHSIPKRTGIPDTIEAEILIKLGDDITTDHILPGGAKILPLRSNIPAISQYVFSQVDEGFVKRTEDKGGGIIVGGSNYGQGSSREHAAIAPMFLGVHAVIAKDFSRIHRANLINFGILPLTFTDESDYDTVEQGSSIVLSGIDKALADGSTIKAAIGDSGKEIELSIEADERGRDILTKGGLLNYHAQKGNS
jgi:aconitate hydratase